MTLATALQLCRIPNVFTAMANVAAGIVLARGGGFRVDDLRLVFASAALYCAGMVFNDVFDRDVDAMERPERPIPSGAASVGAAVMLGLGLVSAGVALCWTASCHSLAVGGGLVIAIVAYDGVFKGTRLGPVSMGLCRALNVMLGLSVATWWSPWMITAAVTMGCYTAIITYIARDEVVGSALARGRRAVAMLLVLGVGFALAMVVFAAPRTQLGWIAVIPFLAFIVFRGLQLFEPLTVDASGPTIGRAVGGGILLMPAIDAVVVAGGGHIAAAALVFCFALPAYVLKRTFYVT